MKRSARITIHPEALQHNLKRARECAPNSKVFSVIKANAYGHNSVATAGTLYPNTDAFAVSCVPEAVVLREGSIDLPIKILQGHQNNDDLNIAADLNLRLMVHEERQLTLLDQYSNKGKKNHRFDITLKVDSGMHRLGFQPDRIHDLYTKLKNHPHVNPDNLMLATHFSSADEPDKETTLDQVKTFNKACEGINAPKSLCNSAGVLVWKDAHADWVRPGIMLYGSSPFSDKDKDSDSFDLQAAMTFEAPVISVHTLKKGDCIGYSATWQCPKDMQVAVIACGYADGYPRHAASGTPVWINGKTTELLGRVAMDMIVVNADDHKENPIKVGDWAELWGKNLSVDSIAEKAETIPYEILCNAGNLRQA
ncbi:alanine racemase [uncultured Cocleimonas sp.]|uniref:alanine racemase n=1 Tax=uncultured Cocleimonas sp. TaxID=1051587 RepID=UPI002614200F|nr:alanine racemase [uncultured Cocleimonas sp.]